jgi:hypothetical protein
MARGRVSKYLENAAPSKDEDSTLEEYRWIGNVHEIVFELAALFAYEFRFEVEGNYLEQFKLFQTNGPLFTSELAKSLTYCRQSPVPMEVCVHVLQVWLTTALIEFGWIGF